VILAVYMTLGLMKSVGRSLVRSLSPEQVLGSPWRALNADELARYLRRLIVAERKCMNGDYPRWMRPRFTWRRLSVAHRLLALGGRVDPQVFTQPNARAWSPESRPTSVPARYSWRGVFSLVPLPEGAHDA
jgi:hypothetical protein